MFSKGTKITLQISQRATKLTNRVQMIHSRREVILKSLHKEIYLRL